MEPIQAAVLEHLEHLVSEQMLPEQLQKIPIIIAFSGGLDSSVLLHACVQLLKLNRISNLSAAHVNHGLQPMSLDWQHSCQSVCQRYDIPFLHTELNLLSKGETSENSARLGRYHFFEKLVAPNSVMLFAHHLDDQVETLMFRILRGSGIHGLCGMPVSRELGQGWLLRPLLALSRKELTNYAVKYQLNWVEDPSNQTDDYSRNYLRNQVIPVIKSKWPKMSVAFSQLSRVANDQVEILDEVALDDISAMENTQGGLLVKSFNQLSVARRNNLLHCWVKNQAGLSPTSGEILQAIQQLEQSSSNKLAIKASSGWLRCHGFHIYFCATSEPEKMTDGSEWLDLSLPLKLDNGVELQCVEFNDLQALEYPKLRKPLADEKVTVRPRVGGEKAKPSYREHSTELKKIYQELNIPNWKRNWLPLIFYNDSLVAVPGVFVDKSFLANTAGFVINLRT